MAIYTIHRGVDLDAPIVPEGLRGDLYVTENSAHRFIVTATRGGEPVTLDGQVVATFIRADGGTEEITGGIDNGAAVVTLPQSCYAVPGRFSMTIFNAGADGSMTAVYACVGNVINTTTNTIIDPGSVVPTMTDITAAYNAAQAAVATANAAAGATSGALVGFGPYAAGYDLIGLLPKTTATHNGVTYTWDGAGRCKLTGTATSFSVNNLWSQGNLLPPGMEPGMVFKATRTSSASPSQVTWQIRWYLNGTEDTAHPVTPTNGELITVPSTATGARIRLTVDSGAAFGTTGETLTIGLARDYTYKPRGVLADQTDLDTVTTAGYYLMTSSRAYINAPITGALTYPRELEVLPVTGNTILQRVTDPYAAITYTRVYQGAIPSWSSWIASPTQAAVDTIDQRTASDTRAYGILPSGDLNNATTPGYYLLNSTASGTYSYYNAPPDVSTTGGQLEVLKTTNNTILQRVTFYGTGNVYIRQSSGGAFSQPWKLQNRERLTFGKYVAFGDSLTAGAVWRDEDHKAQQLFYAATQYQMPTRIARALGAVNNYDNAALGGAGYIKKSGGADQRNIVELVKDYDFTGVEVVTIMGGANDKAQAGTPLGSSASTAGDGSICGAIKEIINWFKNNPSTTAGVKAAMQKIQLIFIQPTPSLFDATHDPWTTRGAGGWSMNDFDAIVSELCRAEHVGYVNWMGCTYCDTWAQRNVGYSSGNGPNYTHPIVETDYALLGDFIAGKVAAYGYNGASTPVPPTTNGAYRLTATVSGGAVTYSWEAV